jgi:L-seryl-tRNA(Ser) seleniumtransferase
MEAKQKTLRQIPSVNEILKQNSLKAALSQYPREVVVDVIRKVLESQRRLLLKGGENSLNYGEILTKISDEINKQEKKQLKHVINATGVIVHTNLGRSLLAEGAIKHLVEVARYYNNLEYNLAQGKRGSRYSHVESLLCQLSRVEAAMVVNNNAGAVFLTLNTLASGKEVIVSRGELIEIGGSFRIPDVMARSGAILVEVGTTNRTHLFDYEQAINSETSLLMKVHKSNYKIIGFTNEVSLEELVGLGHQYNLAVFKDLGSGNFLDFTKYGLEKEPTVKETIATGVDVVSFSGDKLLGGPQAGIILGKQPFIDLIKKNPLNRALRIDKFTLAALETTLRLYQDETKALKEIPTLHLLTISQSTLRKRASYLKRLLKRVFNEETLRVETKASFSCVGGGALPEQKLASFVVAIKPVNILVIDFQERLRFTEPPLIGRIEEDFLYLDVRTIQDEEIKLIPQVIKIALEEGIGKRN